MPTKELPNYFPNNMNETLDLLGKQKTWMGGGRKGELGDKVFDRAKKFKTGQELLDGLSYMGYKDEDLGVFIIRNILKRKDLSVNTIREWRTLGRARTELPELFRKLPKGTIHDWQKAVQPGESIWIPKGLNNTGVDEWLSADELGKMVDAGEVTQKGLQAFAVPIELKDEITKVSTRLADEGTMMDWYDKVLNVFKATAIASPGFIVRNFVSSASQNYVAGMDASAYLDVLRVLAGKDEVAKVMGKSVKEWRKLFDNFGVSQGGFAGAGIESLTSKTAGSKIAKGIAAPFELNRAINMKQEIMHRGALFMDSIKKGMTPAEAMNRTKKFHFDYAELTDFEKKWMKRIIPFYAWSRKNIPLQLEMLFRAPGKYRNIAKLKEAIQGDAETQYNPDWWRQQDVWTTKAGGAGVFVGLPYADLNTMGNPASMGSPLMSAVNVLRNYDPFYKQPIQEFKGQIVPVANPLGEGALFTVNPKLKYAIESVLPIFKRYGFDLSKEIQGVMTSDDPKYWYKIASKIAGVKIIPQMKEMQDKKRVYDLFNQLREYQRYREQQESRGL